MGGAGWFWKNRGKERKPLPELSWLIDLTHSKSILYFHSGKLVIITRVLLAWTDDFLIIMRRDLSQWVFTTSVAIALCRLDQTWNYQGLAVFWRVLRTDPSVQHQLLAIARCSMFSISLYSFAHLWYRMKKANICCSWMLIIWRSKTAIAKQNAWFAFMFTKITTHLPRSWRVDLKSDHWYVIFSATLINVLKFLALPFAVSNF